MNKRETNIIEKCLKQKKVIKSTSKKNSEELKIQYNIHNRIKQKRIHYNLETISKDNFIYNNSDTNYKVAKHKSVIFLTDFY